MLVLPVEGRLIRDPFTKRPVPPEGLEVDVSEPFWARSLADQDVALAPATIPEITAIPATNAAPVAIKTKGDDA